MPDMGEGYLPLLYIPDGAGRYAKLPVLTTTQRNALTAVKGMRIFNSTTGQAEDHDGSNWVATGQPIMTTHIADLDAHTFNMMEKLRTGQYFVGTSTQSRGAVALAADRIWAHVLFVARDMTIDRIGLNVAVGESGKVARLGIYKNDGTNLYPGTLLADYGTVSLASAAFVAITINQALTKGIYWIAMVSNRTSATFTAHSLAWSPLGVANAAASDQHQWNVVFSYAALPDPYTAGGATTTFGSAGLVRVASLD